MGAVYARNSRPILPEELDFGSNDVECPVCGAKDNHASHRRGLCIWCYCSISNAVGDDAVQRMSADELARKARAARLAAIKRGTAPRIGKPPKAQTICKPSASARERKRAYMREYHKRRKAEELQDAARLAYQSAKRKEWNRDYYQRHKEEIAAKHASMNEEERAIKRAYDKLWRTEKKHKEKRK